MSPRTRLYIVAAIALVIFGGGGAAVYCAASYFQGLKLNARAYDKLLAEDFDGAIALYNLASRKMLNRTNRALTYGNRGWCYSRKQQDDQAIRDFTESIRLDPRPVYSVLDRGLAYHRRGEFEKALADYDTAISKDPNQIDALYNRGLLFADRGDWPRAITDFTEAIRCDPKNAQLFVQRGIAYEALNQLDSAIANFDAALMFFPIHAGAYIHRAEVYRRKGDPAKGLADVTEAIRQMPKVERLLYARAYIYLDRGAITEAIADCNEALRLAPNYDLAYLLRARAYAHLRDWNQTLGDADKALKITPNSEWGHYLRARALTGLGDFDAAIAELDQVVKLNPADTYAIVLRAENYTYRHEHSRARDDLRAAVARFPGVVVTHVGLGWFLATCPNDAYRDAKEALAEAIKACDLSNWEQWYTLDTLAAAYAENGEFEEAIRYANRALSLSNLSPQERYFVEKRLLGYNYGIAARDFPPSSIGHGPFEEAVNAYARRNYDEAINRLNTILPPNPGASLTAAWFHFFERSDQGAVFAPSALADRRDLANAFYYRGLAYQKKNEPDNAIADFSSALRLEPDSAACLRERGFAYFLKNLYESAQNDFDEAIRRDPNDALTYCYRADSFRSAKQWEPALEAVNTSIRLDPKLARAYYVRGWIHKAQKEYELALADFEKADWLEPNREATLHSMARTLIASGSYKSADRALSALVQRFPKSASAQNARAWFKATCPDGTFRSPTWAVIDARTACELSGWDNPSYLDTLAAAYADNGEFDQAVKYATRAIEKMPASDPNRPRLMEHLAFFQRKQPWRTSNSDDE